MFNPVDFTWKKEQEVTDQKVAARSKEEQSTGLSDQLTYGNNFTASQL